MVEKLAKLQNGIKDVLKEGNTSKYSTLKFLLSKVQNAEIEARGQGREFNEADFDKVVLKEIKSHEESIEAYKKGGREDLVAKEVAEVAILKGYAPKLLGEEEVKAVVETKYQALSASGPVEFGQLMGEVMRELKGKANGEMVKRLVNIKVQSSNAK